MKARFVSKAALCVSALTLVVAVPAMAQQVASPATSAATQTYQLTKAETALLQKMEAIVQAGKKAGSLDLKAVSGILDQAAKTPVSDRVMGQLVALATSAYPQEAPRIAAAATKAYGPAVTKAQVKNIVNATVSAQPAHFANVEPVCAAVKSALGNSPVVADMHAIAIEVAESTIDNPLPDITNAKDGAGALVEPESGDPIGTLQPANPVSNGAGN